MPKTSLQNIDDKGKDSKLPKFLSDLTPSTHLLHLSVLRELTNNRAGTASTKTRAEVRGGGRKPWKQKGTGRARAGSIRSPLWVGGGIAFGPKPRTYNLKLSKKSSNLALAQAIATKSNELVILKKLPKLSDFKTKNFIKELKSLNLSNKPILFISSARDESFYNAKKASNNLMNVVVKDSSGVGVFEILKANTLVITEGALDELEKRLSKVLRSGKAKVT